MSAPDFHSLSRRCVDGICHCDWRLTLQNCAESRVMTIIHGIHIGMCGITTIIGIILLSHRVIFKGHRLFDSNLSKGCFRPKPIDSMLLFIIIFNILRLISSTILITDVCPDMISRSFIYEFPWQFCLGAFALYLIGIAQTLSDSHRVIANSWLPSSRFMDMIGCTILLAPFLINNAISLSAGILAEKDLPLAELFTRLLYIFWFVHCFSLAVAVNFAAYRLIRILGDHLKKFDSTGPRYVSVQTGIFKIRAVVSIITFCLLLFAAFLLAYGILRSTIIVNELGSVGLGGMWTYLGAVSTLGVEIAIIFNPKVDDTGGLGIKSTGDDDDDKPDPTQFSYSNFTTQEYSASNSSPSATQGTLSLNAFDELKLQQLQYQKVFQKHNQYQLPHKNDLTDISTSESRQLKLSAAGIPLEDDDYPPNQSINVVDKTHPFPMDHLQFHHLDDDRTLDDGESSQMDLVEHASKN